MDFDVGIIGGGPGGLTCAIYLARAGVSAAVFERMSAGGQAALTDQIDNYPGIASVSGAELGAKMAEQAAGFGAKLLYEDVRSLSLDGDVKHIFTPSRSYACRALVLAMGARPKKLNVPGEAEFTGRGVSYCATCDGAFFRGMDVAVAGGGNTAVKDALYLSRFATSVTVLVRRDRLRAVGREAAQMETSGNVTVRYGVVIDEIIGESVMTGLLLRDVQTDAVTPFPVSGLFVAVGAEPQNDLINGGVALDENGCVMAGEDCATNMPGVYAVGDIRGKSLRQVVTAAADGANAAAAIIDYLT